MKRLCFLVLYETKRITLFYAALLARSLLEKRFKISTRQKINTFRPSPYILTYFTELHIHKCSTFHSFSNAAMKKGNDQLSAAGGVLC